MFPLRPLACLFAALCCAPALAVYPSQDPAASRSLNGAWAFKYVPSLAAGDDERFSAPGFDAGRWASISVPSNWELKGFAEPHYADELQDGLGLYRRSFTVPAAWGRQRVFLRFDGVAFGYEVWINGKKAGESSASAFNQHTFDVTDQIAPGENLLAVRVTTKPHGYEFDLNDDWSLSGIYRDVTLFALPATHVRDIATRTRLSDGRAALSVDVTLSQADGEVRAQLIGADGRVVQRASLARVDALQRRAVLEVAKPALWTAETPHLYRLRLTTLVAGKPVQTVEQRIGLREVSVVDKRLLLNGRPIKLRGVNHHDLDPVDGRAISRERLRADLLLMKKGNVNFLRTSHYPPSPALLDLCDEMGMYVMDEVSIGHGEKNLEKPEYRANIVGRVAPTIERDRNHASVIIWSIGNENPITDAELEAGKLAKSLDPSRPITYPKIGSYFAANYQRIPDWVDMYSPHYPNNERLADYANKLTRPTILTEYAHALGLATDRMQEQWDLLEKHPVFAGGAIWHFMDQGLLRTSASPVDTGRPTQLAWLDGQRYYDTHGLDGTDGVTYADRTPQTDFWQMRKVYAPVRVVEKSASVQAGAQHVALTVENHYDFRSLKGMQLAWQLRRNGRVLQQGALPLSAAAGERQSVRVPVTIPGGVGADVLMLDTRLLDERRQAVNERSVLLDAGTPRDWTASLPPAAPSLAETASELTVKTSAWTLQVQRASGELTIKSATGQVLVAGIYPHSGRKATMAEALRAKVSGLWLPSMLTRLESPTVSVERSEGKLRIAVGGYYPLPADGQALEAPKASTDDLMPGATASAASVRQQGLDGGYRIEVESNGVLTIGYAYTPRNASGMLSEAGLSIAAPAGLTEWRWIGDGPYAGYPGKDRLNEFGLHHLQRDDLYFQGNRRGTRFALLTDAHGAGFALALAPGDVAVERHGDQTLVSHNALIGSLGNKGTSPEQTIAFKPDLRIGGSLTLLPLGSRWPEQLIRWFGEPKAARPFKPFLHSYDQ